jgi:acetyl-CoA carboxylase carboxyl transferase subunit beta
MKKIFIKCTHCGFILDNKVFEANHHICEKCGYHGKLNFKDRLALVVDKDSFREMNEGMSFTDPINFPGYDEKYKIASDRTGIKEAVITGRARIGDIEVMLGIMESGFMMGSMGIVVGTKIALLFEEAAKKKLPVIIFAASGGARMQEGIYSLMQMAKTAAAVQAFSESGGYYICVLTNPTTGGVSASFAFLGDTILAEPQAVIGFAGKRVIQQKISEVLPDDFQTSEYLLEHGFIDAIVRRNELKTALTQLLKFHIHNKKDYKRKEVL